MRKKHRNDKNHGKDGWVGGNPRHGRSRGHRRGQAPALKRKTAEEIKRNLEDKANEDHPGKASD